MILFISGLLVCLVALLVGSVLIPQDNRPARKILLFLLAVGCFLLLVPSAQIVFNNQSFSFTLFHIVPAVSISFYVDRLAGFFIFLISLVSAGVSIYSLHYIEEAASGIRRRLIIPLMILFILSMVLFVASANIFSQLIFWELMSLVSFFLVMFNYDREETPKSGLFYFVMTQLSTVFLMFAFIVIYIVNGSFDIQLLSGASPILSALVFLSLLIGFSIKAGVIPFHKWLPYAHSSAPSNISALMSGVMIKVAIYGLFRYVIYVLNPQLWWGVLILALGTISALLGVIYALKEHDIKRLLAYHSIENIGIILIGFGLYLIFQNFGLSNLAFMSLAAALLHTLNHALFKSLLFLTAGSVVEETGTRNIEKMGGLARVMPFTAVLFLIGAISISALPPLNGFVSELMIFQAFFQSFAISNTFIAIVLFISLSLFALTSALAAACFVKAFGIIFLAQPRSDKARHAHEVSRYMLAGPAILALMCILIGVFSSQIFHWLGFQSPIPNLLAMTVVLLAFFILTIVIMLRVANRQSRNSQTWSCGLPPLNSQTEYTASGFSEPVLTIFKPIYRTHKDIRRNFWDKYSSILKDGSAEIHTMKIFEEKIYLPIAGLIRRISQKISDSHNVDLDTFILYSFVTIVILLVVVGWIL